MKLKMIVVMLLLPMAVVLKAQDPDKESKQKQRLDKMTEKLSLTPEQKVLIEDLNKKHKEQLSLLLKDRKANSGKIKDLKKQHKQDIKAVLTPKQLAKLKEIKKEKQDQKDKMKAELKLYHQTNIEPTLRKMRTDFDTKLSPEERKTIEVMRKKLGVERKEMKNGEKQFHSKNGHRKSNGRHEKSETMKKEIKEKLEPIVLAHKASLDSIKTSIELSKVKWQSDMDAIKVKFGIGGDSSFHKKHGPQNHRKVPENEENKLNHKFFKFLLMRPDSNKK